jgi:DNA modification methylase
MSKKFEVNSLINTAAFQKLLTKELIDSAEDLINEIEKNILQYVADKSKEMKNKNRIVKNDLEKDHIPANEYLSENQKNKLPNWVRKEIQTASIIGNSRTVVQVQNGRKYHLRNELNDLSGGEWTFFLNSVINTRYKTNGEESYAHHIRKIHPSPKPPQLCKNIIEFFSKENEIVLDFFMGVGGTLLGASLSNRRAIGIELNNNYIETYKEANKYLGLVEQPTINADSVRLLEEQEKIKNILGDEKVSLILIDPPYGNMMARKKTGQSVKDGSDTSPTPYTDLDTDLGNMELNDFYEIFKNSVINAMPFLKTKGHLVVFIKDLQPNGKELNLLHCELIRILNEVPELNYLGLKIWADNSVNLYPYGYPFSFVSNQIHQYIIIFKKQ